MTPQECSYYRKAMEVIKAQEQLDRMEAITYPKMHKQDKDKTVKKWKSRQLRSETEKVLKTTELRLI